MNEEIGLVNSGKNSQQYRLSHAYDNQGQNGYQNNHATAEEEEVKPKDAVEEKGCIVEILEQPFVNRTIFISLLLYGFFSITSDWIIFTDMLQAKTGLVYGPPEMGIKVTMGIVCVVSIFLYIGETVNLIREVFYGEEVVDDDAAQAVSIWAEEVPQMTLNMLITACREVPLSYFQLVKSGIAIVGAVLRLLIMLIHLCLRKETKKEKKDWFIRLLILIGSIYMAGSSLTVFFFTYTTPPGDGFGFKLPKSIVSGRTDGGKYFFKSGVFFNHPSLELCNNSKARWNESDSKWVRVGTIYHIQDATKYQKLLHVNYSYTEQFGKFGISYALKNGSLIQTCYSINFSSCAIEMNNACPSFQEVSNNATTIYLDFRYIAPDPPKLVLGDITFNGKAKQNNKCHQLQTTAPGYLYSNHTNDQQKNFFGQLQYFQANKDVNDTFSFYQNEDNSFSLYNKETQIRNVSQTWKTGYTKCPMSGAYSPNMDTDKIKIPC